jgi:hypothetical protein
MSGAFAGAPSLRKPLLRIGRFGWRKTRSQQTTAAGNAVAGHPTGILNRFPVRQPHNHLQPFQAFKFDFDRTLILQDRSHSNYSGQNHREGDK